MMPVIPEAKIDRAQAPPLSGPPWARVLRVVGYREAARLLSALGVPERELERLRSHVLYRLVQLGPIPNEVARRIKRHFAHIGGEAAIPEGAYAGSGECEMILMGRLDQFDQLCRRLELLSEDLATAGAAIRDSLTRDTGIKGSFLARGRALPTGGSTLVMGILNVTPDSFSDGGQFMDPERAVSHGISMWQDGAQVIDVGGASSRPGADPVPAQEQISRVVPVIERLAKETDAVISVDTTSAEVAEAALEAGAHIVNDISALREDPRMAEVVRAKGAGVVLMHMRGTPKTMQELTDYQDLQGEVWRFLAERAIFAMSAGIPQESIAVDPGIGFAKTWEQNLSILRRLGEFRSLGLPLVVGPSRKSFIGKVLDLPVEERLEGTAAAAAWAVFQGAWMVRVHDVKPIVRVCKLVDAILTSP
jgi:dihydropteroate synthase